MEEEQNLVNSFIKHKKINIRAIFTMCTLILSIIFYAYEDFKILAINRKIRKSGSRFTIVG